MSTDAYPNYNVPVSLSFRLTISFSPLLVWGAFYVASLLSGISLIRFTPWIRIVGLILGCLSLGLFIFDRPRIANALMVQVWALYGALLWIKYKYKRDSPNQGTQAMTSLRL